MSVKRFLAGLALCLPFAAHAALAIQHWQTPQGARVLFVENHALPMLDIAVGFPAGSARDPAGKPGLATLTHRLLDQGAGGLSDTEIAHRLADWRYATAGAAERPIRSKLEWAALWDRMNVPEPARIAFDWAQFPAAQTFAPGDWNQGMTAYDVPRGGRFDLHFVWGAGGRTLSGTLAGVQCAGE